MIANRQIRCFSAALWLIVLSGCAHGLHGLPSGTGTPFPAFASAYEQAMQPCRPVRTMTAVLSLSGRAGRTKLRGRMEAGFAAPGQLRLEALAPFGRPLFVLVAHDSEATLVFYRDSRVLRGAPPAAVIEALAGVSLAPDDLRGALAGCGLAADDPTYARAYSRDWLVVQSASTNTWLHRVRGVWRLVASVRGPVEIHYDDFVATSRPATVRIRSSGPGTVSDLRVRLSQVEVNVPLQPEVFQIEIPPGATPLTLDDLRRVGPLGTSGSAPLIEEQRPPR